MLQKIKIKFGLLPEFYSPYRFPLLKLPDLNFNSSLPYSFYLNPSKQNLFNWMLKKSTHQNNTKCTYTTHIEYYLCICASKI